MRLLISQPETYEPPSVSLLTVELPEYVEPETTPETTIEPETETIEESSTEPEVIEVAAEEPMFTNAEIAEIARVTYLETGSQGEEYYYVTYLTACVIINRYLDWGYGSIAEVIHAPGQYATADKYDDWGGGELVINDVTWQAVYAAIENTDRNPHYQACSYSLEKYGLTMYYDDGQTQIYY